MLFILTIALLGVLMHIFCFGGAYSRRGRLPRYGAAFLFLAALSLRLLAAALSKGFGSDTACFAAWADRMFETGPGGFYSPSVFTDYPPGYMYILWLLGAVRKVSGLEYYSVSHLVLLKLPSILCDMACGWLLFREAARRLSEEQAFFLSLAYLFNPAILLNSSVWGQVDSLFTLAVVLMCLYLIRGKLPAAYIAFGFGILIKPQMLLFSPVLLAGILDWVFLKDFSLRKFLYQLFLGFTAAAGTLILCLPFGLENVWNQYFSTLSSYPYAAVNACNFWGLLGLNWISQDSTFLGIPYRIYGGAAIAAAILFMLLYSLRCRRYKEKYPFLGALLILTVFIFSVRMHERYMYPGLLLLLFAYVYKPDGLCFLCYGGFSLMHFLNTANVLFFYDPANYDRKSPFMLAVSGGMLLCGGLLYYTALRSSRPHSGGLFEPHNPLSRGGSFVSGASHPKSGNSVSSTIFLKDDSSLPDITPLKDGNSLSGTTFPKDGSASADSSLPRDGGSISSCNYFNGRFAPWTSKWAMGSAPRASKRSVPLKKRDIIIMLVITILYSCFALYDLGSREAPSTSLDLVQNQSVELDFGESIPAGLWYYMAPWHERHFYLEGRNDVLDEWTYLGEITLNKVFTWQELTLENPMRCLRFTLTSTQASLLEWVFYDANGNSIVPEYDSSCQSLFDEASLYPENVSAPAAAYSPQLYYRFGSEMRLSAGTDADKNLTGSLPRRSTAVSPGKNSQRQSPLLLREELLARLRYALYYPEAGSCRNSMYFDEIYHGRTAYEFLHGLTSYENTHPPLGKILISLGVALFGMNPFGWRIIGTVFGIVMVPLIYLFAKKITGYTSLASLACMLFAFDFMHFSQTRIATIDVYVTFFIILMYYFMYRYCCLSFYDTSLKKTWLPLGACGICMGLAIASKWTGVYAGAGLALIFFTQLFRRYREYLYARTHPGQYTGKISHDRIEQTFAINTWRTIVFCLLFFVIIPAAIYLLSYIPFRDYSDRGLISRMLYNQTTMFDYHSKLEATHYFSSPWYEWPVILRPIWFYSHVVTQTAADGLREGISSFGNPAVWWAGIPAVLYMIYPWIRKKDRTAAFLTTGYLTQYLPWFFVSRITFIYHYFPSVAFVVLMIVYSLKQWRDYPSKGNRKIVFHTFVFLYGAAALGLFLLFYPVLSGQPVEFSFADKYLRWFKTWVLIAR